MSYNNYIPTVWAEAINRELTKAHVFAANTNREYEGKVSRLGDSVRILGIGSPTVTTYDMNSKDNKFTGLADPETIEDTSTTLISTNSQYSTTRLTISIRDRLLAVSWKHYLPKLQKRLQTNRIRLLPHFHLTALQ